MTGRLSDGTGGQWRLIVLVVLFCYSESELSPAVQIMMQLPSHPQSILSKFDPSIWIATIDVSAKKTKTNHEESPCKGYIALICNHDNIIVVQIATALTDSRRVADSPHLMKRKSFAGPGPFLRRFIRWPPSTWERTFVVRLAKEATLGLKSTALKKLVDCLYLSTFR